MIKTFKPFQSPRLGRQISLRGRALIARARRFALCLALACGLAAWHVAFAQVPGSAVEPLTNVDRIVLAERIARYAREAGDAEAMIVASRMLRDTQVVKGDFGGSVIGGKASISAPLMPALPTAEAYLTEARLLAAGKPETLAFVEAERERYRRVTRGSGAAGGALAMPKVLQGGTTWKFDLLVEAGVPAMVAAIGDGDSDVNIRVLDVSGSLIGSDNAPDYQAVVRWTPSSASRFSIEVHNAGPVPTYIVVYSN